MNNFNKPVLFITFNRLNVTKKVFAKIKEIKPKKLYIASDGPRNESEREKVNEIREYLLSAVDWNCELKTRFREKNLGVGFGPNDAISWFFSQEEDGIILEDDCLPSRSFFYFCEELLNYYKENKRIGVIQGFSPFSKNDYQYSYFFSKYDLKWGWATWRDRWELQDMYTSVWPEIKKSDFLTVMFGNNLVKKYWENAFDIIHRNPELAWDTQFTFQLLKRNLITVVPNKNIVLNIGYGPDATSTKWNVPEHIKVLNLEEIEFPIVHPPEIQTNAEYDRLVEKIHFRINLLTVMRLKIINVLEADERTKKYVLPVFEFLFRKYKKFKMYWQ